MAPWALIRGVSARGSRGSRLTLEPPRSRGNGSPSCVHTAWIPPTLSLHLCSALVWSERLDANPWNPAFQDWLPCNPTVKTWTWHFVLPNPLLVCFNDDSFFPFCLRAWTWHFILLFPSGIFVNYLYLFVFCVLTFFYSESLVVF